MDAALRAHPIWSVDCRVFLFGTLAPGQLRWPWLEEHCVVHRSVTVPGTLYSAGLGNVVADFDGASEIEGVLATVEIDMAGFVLAMDQMLRPNSVLDRIVRSTDGDEMITVRWLRGFDGLTVIDGGQDIGDPGTVGQDGQV